MENRYFYCYSKPLKDFLLENKIKYINRSIHEKTQKKFWVFLGDTKLNDLLEKWKNNNK